VKRLSLFEMFGSVSRKVLLEHLDSLLSDYQGEQTKASQLCVRIDDPARPATSFGGYAESSDVKSDGVEDDAQGLSRHHSRFARCPPALLLQLSKVRFFACGGRR